jgi:hypothetical protein
MPSAPGVRSPLSARLCRSDWYRALLSVAIKKTIAISVAVKDNAPVKNL